MGARMQGFRTGCSSNLVALWVEWPGAVRGQAGGTRSGCVARSARGRRIGVGGLGGCAHVADRAHACRLDASFIVFCSLKQVGPADTSQKIGRAHV